MCRIAILKYWMLPSENLNFNSNLHKRDLQRKETNHRSISRAPIINLRHKDHLDRLHRDNVDNNSSYSGMDKHQNEQSVFRLFKVRN